MNEQDRQDLFMLQLQSELQHTHLPIQVDVVDSVMSRIEFQPAQIRTKRHLTWAASAAACLLFGLAISIPMLRSHDANSNPEICDLFAEVYNSNYSYDDDYSLNNTSYQMYETYL